jgi:hypothetical protein
MILAASVLLASLLFSGFVRAEPALQVKYPNLDGLEANAYGYRVLNLALRKSGVDFELSLHPLNVNQERARIMLDSGEVNVVDFGTSAEFEHRFLPVYFPIDRGLNGYRLLVVHKDNADEYARMRSITQLSEKTAGQGLRWSDIAILERAGIKVTTASLDGLFRLLERKRIDFIPLGANEVHYLLDKYGDAAPHAVVDSNLLIIYPFGRLFFVQKGNERLREAISRGLEAAFDDGSFQALLSENYFPSNDLSALTHRTILRLDNPSLTPEFRKIPHKYFHHLER